MKTALPQTEADILDDIFLSQDRGITPAAARSFLRLHFNRTATERIRKLLRKNNAGTSRADENLALERYLRVGQFLDLLQAKARLSLSKRKKGR